MALFGIPAAALDAAKEGDEFEVYPENWEAVKLFLDCSTQWVIAGMGGMVGLNYQSVDFMMRLRGIENSAETFDKVQVMEREALAIMSERQQRESRKHGKR